MKDRCVIITKELQTQAAEQLHSNHMLIEKTMLLACGCIYWTNVKTDIKAVYEIVYQFLLFSKCSLKRELENYPKLCKMNPLDVVVVVEGSIHARRLIMPLGARGGVNDSGRMIWCQGGNSKVSYKETGWW